MLTYNLRDQYDKHYSQCITAFVNEVEGSDGTGIPEPHLPLWGSQYESAELRIGFIGQETRQWGDMNKFLAGAKKCPIAAAHRYETSFNSFEFTQRGWVNNFGTTFFDTALQLLACFHGLDDWKKLKRREDNSHVLSSFMWANTNSVEKYEATPVKNGVNYNVWRKLKTASEKYFDSFNTILQMFAPNIIVITNWEIGGHFMDISLPWESIGDHVKYALSERTKTHVFWTAHPTWLNKNQLYKSAIERICTTVHSIVIEKRNQDV